jgi:hypothetical protein
MAQEVGYFENHVKYTEGPFVIVDANGWRIEVELKEYHCPVLPEDTIYQLCKEKLGRRLAKFDHKSDAATLCDWLNQEVRQGSIVLDNRWWICPRFIVSEVMEA